MIGFTARILCGGYGPAALSLEASDPTPSRDQEGPMADRNTLVTIGEHVPVGVGRHLLSARCAGSAARG
jgi:hypothetical protein